MKNFVIKLTGTSLQQLVSECNRKMSQRYPHPSKIYVLLQKQKDDPNIYDLQLKICDNVALLTDEEKTCHEYAINMLPYDHINEPIKVYLIDRKIMNISELKSRNNDAYYAINELWTQLKNINIPDNDIYKFSIEESRQEVASPQKVAAGQKIISKERVPTKAYEMLLLASILLVILFACHITGFYPC